VSEVTIWWQERGSGVLRGETAITISMHRAGICMSEKQ
jgi:hypothetical protein